MLTLDMRTGPDVIEPRTLHALAGLERDLRRGWPDLPEPLVLPWTEEPLLLLDQRVPCLCAPVERDPLATRGGHTVLPRKQLRRLTELAERGLPFQRLAIAHELDATGPVHHLLPQLTTGPRTCTDAVARAVLGPLPAHPGLTRAAGALARLTGGAAAGALAAAEFLLDPILFGVLAPGEPEHGRPSLWTPLLVWRW
jgi:hypothetical protein